MNSNLSDAIIKLNDTITHLRHPTEGCPWDLEQTHQSLISHLIEETYELINAIKTKNTEEIKDELGDVLLQVVLHSVIAKENNDFSLVDVIKNLNDKMVRRHTHVFGSAAEKKRRSMKELKENWKKIKLKENQLKSHKQQYGPLHKWQEKGPAATQSEYIGVQAKKVNFDWKGAFEVLEHVKEEIQELEVELKDFNTNDETNERVKEELGDVFFTLTQLARHLNLSSEEIMYKANIKFANRFKQIEQHAKLLNKDLKELSAEQYTTMWNKIKSKE